jgi:hypothetical protein
MKQCRLWLLVVAAFLSSSRAQQQQHIVQFLHGNWFDGAKFRPQTWYSVNGFLRYRDHLRSTRLST